MLRAVAIGRTADGQVLVETRFGQLALDLSINPVRGTVLQFQISRAGIATELTLIDATAGRDGKISSAQNARPQAVIIRAGNIVQIRQVPTDVEGGRTTRRR